MVGDLDARLMHLAQRLFAERQMPKYVILSNDDNFAGIACVTKFKAPPPSKNAFARLTRPWCAEDGVTNDNLSESTKHDNVKKTRSPLKACSKLSDFRARKMIEN